MGMFENSLNLSVPSQKPKHYPTEEVSVKHSNLPDVFRDSINPNTTGTIDYDSKVYKTPTHPVRHQPRYITEQEIKAATGNDIIYRALAEIAIRHGYWIVVKSEVQV